MFSSEVIDFTVTVCQLKDQDLIIINTKYDNTTLEECANSTVSKMKEMRQDLRDYHQYVISLEEEIQELKNEKLNSQKKKEQTIIQLQKRLKWANYFSYRVQNILDKNNPPPTNNPPPLESIINHDNNNNNNNNNKRNVSGSTLNSLPGAASSSHPRP